VKGFLLSYAKYIGLDPNDVLLHYEGSLKRKSVTRPEEAPPEKKSVTRPEEAPPEKKIVWNRRYLWMIGGVILVGIFSSYFLFLHPSKTPMEPISVKPKVEKTLPSPPQKTGKIPTPEEQPFSLQLKAVEQTWVRIQIDGQSQYDMTLKPGESTSHQAQKRISLLVGNAGGLNVTFKGKILEKSGKSGEVVNLIFTPQGVETKRFEPPKPKPE
jgi:cytoskeletal protein RodZ